MLSMARADESDPVGRKLDWRNEQIEDVVSFQKFGSKTIVDGNECVTGGHLNFKVNDEIAFDIDEPVDVTVAIQQQRTALKLVLMHDGNGLFAPTQPPQFIEVPASPNGSQPPLYRQTVTLDRARFANLGFHGADLTIAGDRPYTLCDLTIKRSYATPVHTQFGRIALDVLDEQGRRTPVRVGLYDQTGRLPLPSDEAIPLRNGAQGITRISEVGGVSREIPVWSHANRSVFYIDGSYQAKLPPGRYELIVAKGPEYRTARQTVTVKADATNPIKIRLTRWTDMAALGWYSGDSHFHYARDSAYDDRNLQLFLQAEDVRVGNNFQMGNIQTTYIRQYSWEPVRFGPEKAFALVIGQEDPRTSLLGHVAQMNIRRSYRNPPHYLLYDESMGRAHENGGLVGYAHAINAVRDCPEDVVHSDVTRGLAIDVPAGLVDYMEIMSVNCHGDSLWFDFLNLGYRISPAAGTDFPLGPVLGGLRSYVKIKGAFDPARWHEGLKNGRTFVTSGPMIEFTVNGQDMGSVLQIQVGQPIEIRAKASLNPDAGPIASLELVEQGVVKTAKTAKALDSQIELRHAVLASHSTWFVVRAHGAKPGLHAWSAPVYVIVNGQKTWKKEAVPAIASSLKQHMQDALNQSMLENETVEPFDTKERMNRYWIDQLPSLTKRVKQASDRYDELIRSATESN